MGSLIFGLLKEGKVATLTVYNVREVADLLKIEVSKVYEMYDNGNIIGFNSGNEITFPDYQFEEGAIIEGLPKLIGVWKNNGAIAARNLTTVQESLDNSSVLDLLKSGERLRAFELAENLAC